MRVIGPRDKMTRNGAIRYCPGCEQWLPRDEHFTKTRDKRCVNPVYPRRCRDCLRRARTPRGGYVAVGHVQGVVKGMIEQVGYRETCRRIGVSGATVSYWLHRSIPRHGKYAKRILKTKAAQVALAREQLKQDIIAGKVVPMREGDRRRLRKRLGLCSGCGTEMDNYTDGCGTCVDRRAARAKRAA